MSAADRKKRKSWPWILAGLAAAAAVAVLVGVLRPGATEADDNGPTAVVRRDDLVVTVNESGEIEADKRITIANELQWPVIIDTIVPDGTIVEANDVIVRFSCKDLDEAVLKQEQVVRDANNDYTQALASLELKKQEIEEKLRKARQAVEDAHSDLARYVKGEGPSLKVEYERDVELIIEELKIQRENLAFKKKWHAELADKSPYTDAEIRSDELSLERKELSLAKARNKRDMFIEYDYPKQVRQLENDVADANLGLVRARIDSEIELSRAQSTVTVREESLRKHRDRLTDLREDQAKLTVRAEREGLVVYDTGRRRRQNDVTIAKGEEIRPRQQIMIIPDMTTLQVETQVYEAVSSMVEPNLPAVIRLETDPGKAYAGRVTKVATLPSRSNWWNPGVKVFDVAVKFDRRPDGLKPNMTAKVELTLEHKSDVLVAPVAAVFSEQDKAYCYLLRDDGGKQKVPVTVALSNEDLVEITDGLSEGDRVLLLRPGDAQSETDPDDAGDGQDAANAPLAGTGR